MAEAIYTRPKGKAIDLSFVTAESTDILKDKISVDNLGGQITGSVPTIPVTNYATHYHDRYMYAKNSHSVTNDYLQVVGWYIDTTNRKLLTASTPRLLRFSISPSITYSVTRTNSTATLRVATAPTSGDSDKNLTVCATGTSSASITSGASDAYMFVQIVIDADVTNGITNEQALAGMRITGSDGSLVFDADAQMKNYWLKTQTKYATVYNGISASSFLSGASLKLGDTGNATRLLNLTGLIANYAGTNNSVPVNITSSSGYLTMSIPSNGYYDTTGRLQVAASTLGGAQASSVRSSTTFTSRHGVAQVGSAANKAAATYAMSTAVQTINAGQYINGVQTISPVTGTAATNDVRSGYTFWSAQSNAIQTGAVANYTTSSFTPTSAAQTIGVLNKYIVSNIVINAVSFTNFTAANIKKGVTITAGGKSVTGTFEGIVS